MSIYFSVSTSLGNQVIPRWVYRNFRVFISHKFTSLDIIRLEVADVEIILGMDWLHSLYASIDCGTRIFIFQYPIEPFLEWKSSISIPQGRFISYLKDTEKNYKGYVYHIVCFKHSCFETLTLEQSH